MTIEAKFGVIGKIGAELQEEGTAVPIHAVDVEVVDHGGGADQPRIGGAGLLITPPLGAEHRRLLLCLANKQHAFLAAEFLAIGGGHVILTLALLEMYDRHFFFSGKLLHVREKRFGDGVHQDTGGEPVAEVKPKKTGYSSSPLQSRHVDVEVHAVNAFHLQGDVLAENIGDGPWYAHLGSG